MKRFVRVVMPLACLAVGLSLAACGGDDDGGKVTPTASGGQGTPPVVSTPAATGSAAPPTVTGSGGTPAAPSASVTVAPTPDAAVVAQFNALVAIGFPRPVPAGVPALQANTAGTQTSFRNGYAAIGFQSGDASKAHIYSVGFIVYADEAHAQTVVKADYAGSGFTKSGDLPTTGLPPDTHCLTGTSDGYGQSICILRLGHAVANIYTAVKDDPKHGDDNVTLQLAALAVDHLHKAGIT